MNYLDFKEILKHLDTLCWKCDIDDNDIFDIAVNNYSKFVDNNTKNHKLIRVAGQSGSGKTSQLLPCAEKYFEKKDIKPISFAVRNFAYLHPNYNTIIERFGISQMREKTNLFALKCLLVTLILAVNDGYDILFEVTMLTPSFEEFINIYLDNNKYDKLFLVLSVNKDISNYFIDKRKNTRGKEAGRIVYKSSTDFFYDALDDSMKYYVENYQKERVIIWDAYSLLPIYDGIFKNALKPFEDARKNISNNFSNEELMKSAKIDYLLNNTK